MSLVIYHHNCFDGFTAAWVANRHLKGNVECMPATYGKNFDKEALLKKIHYRTVYVLDFSYPEHLMVEMAKEAYAIILIDHHKTARWAVNYYPIDNVHNQLEAISKCYSDGLPPLITLFDIERSGAGLTWDFFNPGVKRPKIVEHVEDRDLWKFKNAHTKDIHAYMSSHDFSFENWNKIDSHLSSSDTFYMACHRGDAILAKQEVDINKIIKEQTIKLKIGGDLRRHGSTGPIHVG
jgi:oligoribonuclease NrnB/cAMP/cGMP phosphodiesterase (DHH superfamily)